jgi:hypothetical protein
MSKKEEADLQKADAERHQVYVDMGAFSPEEVRGIAISDPKLPYGDLDPNDLPDEREEIERGLEPEGGRPQPLGEAGPELEEAPDKGGVAAKDAMLPFVYDATAFNESDHPRKDDGEFGSGGGSATASAKRSKLTPTEKAWLSSYSGDDFLRLNKELRAGESGGESAKKIDAAIAKSPLPAGTKLYRGITKDALKSLIGGDQITVGQTLSDKAFLSTSTDPWIAHVPGGVMLDIQVGEGQSGLDMSQISSNEHEKEVLLPRGAKLKIAGIRAPKKVGQPIIVRVTTEN